MNLGHSPTNEVLEISNSEKNSAPMANVARLRLFMQMANVAALSPLRAINKWLRPHRHWKTARTKKVVTGVQNAKKWQNFFGRVTRPDQLDRPAMKSDQADREKKPIEFATSNFRKVNVMKVKQKKASDEQVSNDCQTSSRVSHVEG